MSRISASRRAPWPTKARHHVIPGARSAGLSPADRDEQIHARRAAETAAIDQATEQSPTPPRTDLNFAADLAGAREAILHYRGGDLSAGDDFARLTSGALRTALDWRHPA